MKINRKDKSLINRRAKELAELAYYAYQSRLDEWVVEQKIAGQGVDEAAINATVPDITDLVRGLRGFTRIK